MVEFSICSVTLARIFSVFIPGPLHFLYFLSSHQHTHLGPSSFSLHLRLWTLFLYMRGFRHIWHISSSRGGCLSHTFVVSVRSPSLITHARRSFMFIDIWTLHNTANRPFVSCILSSSSCFYFLHLIIRAPRTFSRTPASSLSFRTRICIFSVSFPVTYRLTVHVRLPCTQPHICAAPQSGQESNRREKKAVHATCIPYRPSSDIRLNAHFAIYCWMLDRQRTQVHSTQEKIISVLGVPVFHGCGLR